MEKKEFIKLINSILLDSGFIKTKNKVYSIENDELYAVIDIQKSNYDSDSYYLNYGLVLKITGQEGKSTYPAYDFFGRFIFKIGDKKSGLISILDTREDELTEQLKMQINGILMPALKIGFKEYMKINSESLHRTTIRARKYLGLEK